MQACAQTASRDANERFLLEWRGEKKKKKKKKKTRGGVANTVSWLEYYAFQNVYGKINPFVFTDEGGYSSRGNTDECPASLDNTTRKRCLRRR